VRVRHIGTGGCISRCMQQGVDHLCRYFLGTISQELLQRTCRDPSVSRVFLLPDRSYRHLAGLFEYMRSAHVGYR
jgi:hypothetical protein